MPRLGTAASPKVVLKRWKHKQIKEKIALQQSQNHRAIRKGAKKEEGREIVGNPRRSYYNTSLILALIQSTSKYGQNSHFGCYLVHL